MDPRKQAIKELEAAGYVYKPSNGGHDKYTNPVTHEAIMLKRHKFSESTLRYIRQEIRRKKG